MENIAGWVAPAATMIAAIMTAANLGARVTGWGFAVFVLGSVCWSVVGLTSGQTNLVLTNGFLTLVNLMGVWRWLGRQARYEEGGSKAAEKSERHAVPTLMPAGGLAGTNLTGRDGETLGTVVEAMLECSDRRLCYLVIAEGGTGGVGERLHALRAEDVELSLDGLHCNLTSAQLAALPTLEKGHWPTSALELERAG